MLPYADAFKFAGKAALCVFERITHSPCKLVRSPLLRVSPGCTGCIEAAREQGAPASARENETPGCSVPIRSAESSTFLTG